MFDSTKVWDSFLSQGGLIIIFIAIMILCLLFMTLIFCILGITNGVLKKTRSRIICGILGLLCLVIGFVDLVVVFKLALPFPYITLYVWPLSLIFGILAIKKIKESSSQ